MIKINLTPPEELENPLWMVPDILLAVLVCIIGLFAVDLYLDGERQQIDQIAADMAVMQAQSTKYAPYVDQLKRLDDQLKQVNSQLTGLSGVAGELVEKYAPIIAIEHIQNLKPDGIWLRTLNINEASVGPQGAQAQASSKPGSGALIIQATAVDNLLVAEFMASLRATKIQAIEASDLRTQVYFENVILDKTELVALSTDLVLLPQQVAVEGVPQAINFALAMAFKSNPVKGAPTVASFHDFYPADARFDVAVK